MKKLTAIALTIILILFVLIPASANEGSSTVFEVNGVTVLFEDNSAFSTEEKQYIAQMLVYGNESISTYGLTCTLFGHKFTEEYVTTITHCVKDTNPRCLKETFKVSTCSRCGYTTSEKINQVYIDCCQ